MALSDAAGDTVQTCEYSVYGEVAVEERERGQALDLGFYGCLQGTIYLATNGDNSRSRLMIGGSFSIV